MRIPEVRSSEAIPEVRPSADDSATPVQSESGPTTEGDHSAVSASANVASQALENRNDRVAELRQQYLSGAYKPDSAKVAAKLVDEHLG